jgi:hypothetical protein
MEGDGGAHEEEWEPLWSARCSSASSSSEEDSPQDVSGVLPEQSNPEDKVFVALPEEFNDGESTLLWALHNLATDGCKIVIAHVHRPTPAITMSNFLPLSNVFQGGAYLGVRFGTFLWVIAHKERVPLFSTFI